MDVVNIVSIPPYAFTKNGIAMLSSVLNSETAIDANIYIMRAFTKSYLKNKSHPKVTFKMGSIDKALPSRGIH